MRNRNPSYPAVSLPVALEKVTLLYAVCGKSEINFEKAFDCWGYKLRSRAGLKLVTAMEIFGLINAIEIDGYRRLKISRVALRDLFSQHATDRHRDNVIQAFAMAPAIYQVLWDKWGAELPKTNELDQFLVGELGFNRNVLKQLTDDYLASIEYAQEHGLKSDTRKNGRDDTDLDFNGDDLEIQVPNAHKYPWLEDDTDTNIEFGNVDVPVKPGSRSRALELEDDEDISLEIIEWEEGDEISVHVSEKRRLPPVQHTKSNLRKSHEFGRYPVSSDCTIYLMADGPVDRGAFEALVAQLTLRLEIDDFDAEDNS